MLCLQSFISLPYIMKHKHSNQICLLRGKEKNEKEKHDVQTKINKWGFWSASITNANEFLGFGAFKPIAQHNKLRENIEWSFFLYFSYYHTSPHMNQHLSSPIDQTSLSLSFCSTPHCLLANSLFASFLPPPSFHRGHQSKSANSFASPLVVSLMMKKFLQQMSDCVKEDHNLSASEMSHNFILRFVRSCFDIKNSFFMN